MKKLFCLLIICALIIIGATGFGVGRDLGYKVGYGAGKLNGYLEYTPHPQAPDPTIDYLIECMETARDSHQYYVDRNPNWHIRWYYIYADEEWVEIYDSVIEMLEKK